MFVFATERPRKLALQITSASHHFLDFVEFSLTVDDINGQLEEKLPRGSIEDIRLVDDVHVYMYRFDNTTKCSDTTILKVPKKMDSITQAIPTQLKANIGWSFFSLIQDPYFDLREHFPDCTLSVKNDYIYPIPDSENERMESLRMAIINYYQLDKKSSEITVARATAGKGNQDSYCEYTGGGDIYIAKKRASSTLSFAIANLENLEMSPSNSTECISSMTIECKKAEEQEQQLTSQLIRNTILCSVTQFARQCKENKITSKEIKEMKELSGYCIAYTGIGYFGFYKLTMRFELGCTLTVKHLGAVRSRPVAAALVDQSLDYFFQRVSQVII